MEVRYICIMIDFSSFLELFTNSVTNDSFVKLTLSKPYRKSEGLVNVYIRLFITEEQSFFQFKYRYLKEELYKQFNLEDAISQIKILLNESFRLGTLFTLNEDVLVTVSKNKNVTYRNTIPSFKNKLPDVPLGS